MKPWRVKGWIIPSKQSADFVYHMEQVLAIYERPYHWQFPVVCVDESPKQLIGIIQYRSADGARIEDSAYIRHGVGEICMGFDPLAGQRFVAVKDDGTGHPAQSRYLGECTGWFVGWSLCNMCEDDDSGRQLNWAAGAVPTSLARFIRFLGLRKPKPIWTGWNLSTHPNMAVGWPWPAPSNYLFYNVIV